MKLRLWITMLILVFATLIGCQQRALKTLTPEPTPTPALSPTLIPTRAATGTDFTPGPTSTQIRPTLPFPTHRPTITLPAGFSGLTAEEKVNEGSHSYTVACQSWGKCECDSALAVPGLEFKISFSIDRVTLNSQATEISYKKIVPNLYRIEDATTLSDIIFTIEGWEFYVTKGGNACALQVFTIK